MTKKLTIGILAHVDAGKTTLAEGLLYTTGQIRNLGRVDHRDAFLDNFAMERDRGITIFSKQAILSWKNMEFTLLDTPGHVDFSAEMERTLQVLDLAVLVISGSDGVQGHTRTLWQLLKQYGIPTFLFINKMDQPETDREALLSLLQNRLDTGCIAFDVPKGERDDCLAMCSESLMEEYLELGTISDEAIAEAIADRLAFPCIFGAALRLQGVETLLDAICQYAPVPEYEQDEAFGARAFKITRDENGNRLTHLKVTSGRLKAKQWINNEKSAQTEGEKWQEKADQLRLYHGAQYKVIDEMPAGGVCAVTGLSQTFVGQGLGREGRNGIPLLSPVLTYQIQLPQGTDPITALGLLRKLEEEEPLLHIIWKEGVKEIHAGVMGEVQIEVLKSEIFKRFDLLVEFVNGSILYRETLAEPAIGIGHFEPLRHYAEVQLLMEPGEPGSGLMFASLLSEDELDKNWQRLIMTHLEEKVHIGVLTGSPITDMRISLIGGRAHTKHTEGGDFRQATYRAVRQGLRGSKNVLLEPVFDFVLEIPTENLGRAMSDIHRMNGHFDSPVTEGEMTIVTGRAPVATMQNYKSEVAAYTKGFGSLSCVPAGYVPCHNTKEVMESIAYDPESDLENPTGSVFCAHGAGFVVPWDQVPAYAHVDSGFRLENAANPMENGAIAGGNVSDYGVQAASKTEEKNNRRKVTSDTISREEIEEIFRQSYGKKKEDDSRYRRFHKYHRPTENPSAGMSQKSTNGVVYSGYGSGDNRKKDNYLLVDGYNIIFAWEELRGLSKVNIDSARDRLMDILCDYQGSQGCTLILVFDAYKVKGNPGSVMQYHNIHVVYTREAETADQYIEKTVHDIGKKHNVTVATSDALEQMIIWGDGAVRMSAQGLYEAVCQAKAKLRTTYGIKEDS